MTAINGYATLYQVQNWIVTPGQTLATAAVDDTVIDSLIQGASRYIDNKTQRHFYPVVETRKFDTPEGTLDDRMLWLGDNDLLAVTTVTNGDDTTLASTEWNLFPANLYPKYAIRLLNSSDYYWERDSSDNREQVIDVLGTWGYHSNYGREAWLAVTTLNMGRVLTDADLTWTVAGSANIKAGSILKIESELVIVASVTDGTTLVIRKRGDNGSTAATHADTTAIYLWQPEPDIVQATTEIVVNAYHRRWGVNVSGTATITPAGVVITPQDIPSGARDAIRNYERSF